MTKSINGRTHHLMGAFVIATEKKNDFSFDAGI